MIAAFLSLLHAAPPNPFTVTPGFVVARAPVAAKPAVYVDPPGWHRHRDSQGHVWTHHESNYGQVGPHTSPWTGELVWQQYHGPQPPETPPRRAVPCPGGR